MMFGAVANSILEIIESIATKFFQSFIKPKTTVVKTNKTCRTKKTAGLPYQNKMAIITRRYNNSINSQK